MKHYGIDSQYLLSAESAATLPAWSTTYKRSFIYAEDVNRMYYGTSTGWAEWGTSGTSGSSGTSGVGSLSHTTLTSSTELTTLNRIIYCDASSGSFTVTLAAPSSMTDYPIYLKKIDTSSNTVTISTPSGFIDDSASYLLELQDEFVGLASDGTDYQVISE